ncbi:MAG: hypothetical protein BWY10_02432 [Chloroflexi bacterium ADurb.Bin180]|nr:MAG: hypothetical protein BWY10_02432 [Chloroflexi bacterium ADurb.Bin180]
MAQQNLRGYYKVVGPVTYSDGAAAYVVGEIPAKTQVLEQRVIITTAFVGTSPAIDLGDEDDDDCFVGAEEVTEGTIGSYRGDGDPSDTYLGAYYPAKKNIVMTLGGTDLTAGVAYGILQLLDLSNSV